MIEKSTPKALSSVSEVCRIVASIEHLRRAGVDLLDEVLDGLDVLLEVDHDHGRRRGRSRPCRPGALSAMENSLVLEFVLISPPSLLSRGVTNSLASSALR